MKTDPFETKDLNRADSDYVNCTVCNARLQKTRLFAKHPILAETLNLYSCLGCQLKQLLPQPSNSWLAEEYADYYRKRGSSIPFPKKEYFQNIFKQERLDLNHKTVLELGSGEGDSIRAVNDLFPECNIVAVEFGWKNGVPEDLKCVAITEFVEDWLKTAVDERSSSLLSSFDYIFLFDLLEQEVA